MYLYNILKSKHKIYLLRRNFEIEMRDKISKIKYLVRKFSLSLKIALKKNRLTIKSTSTQIISDQILE